jgi:TRAP-type C4-dicarboxylate transport system permease small subunit
MKRLPDALAVLGGLAMLLAALLVSISVIGRALFDTPIDGDYEFVKLAMGFAGFAVLPLTEAQGGHVAAETLIERVSLPQRQRIEAFWHLVQALVMGALGYAMALGALATKASGETTMQREIPLWPGIALACLLVVVTMIAALARARRLSKT